VDRFQPPHLSDFVNNGVKAESLIPSFPSKTFPNHYTIATGLYPDNHGILGNLFYSYKKEMTYAIRNREAVEDGSFYGGIPIWVNASKSGMVTASYFFVGSEADIQGIRPTYFRIYDGAIPNKDRVTQALEWLDLPEKKRPHLITMYFSDMDDTGHRYGPHSDENLKKALFELDTVLGELFTGVNETGLPINIIIVSDHGMLEVPLDHYIPNELVLNDSLYRTINNGSIVNIHPHDPIQIDIIYKELRNKEKNFKVYLTENTPLFENIPKNKDWGAIQILPDAGYYFVDLRVIGMHKASGLTVFGQHGFDPNMKEMQGIFYALGPSFKSQYTVPSVKNIHIYPLTILMVT
jgi:predicted AlkP superfamily pyrophosphatase or phosphodiesterase